MKYFTANYRLAAVLILLLACAFADAGCSKRSASFTLEYWAGKSLEGGKKMHVQDGAQPPSEAKKFADRISKSDALTSLLNAETDEETFYKAVNDENVGLIVLKRPAREEPNNLLLKNRLGLGLDAFFFLPVYRNKQITVVAPLPRQLALKKSEIEAVFAYLRGSAASLPESVKGETFFEVSTALYFGAEDKAESQKPSKDVAALLDEIKKSAAQKFAGKPGAPASLSFKIFPPVVIDEDKRPAFMETFVYGTDGVALISKDKRLDFYAESAAERNLSNFNEMSEYLAALNDGSPTTLAERRKKNTFGGGKNKETKRYDPETIFQLKETRVYALRSISYAQETAGAPVVPLYRKKASPFTSADVTLDDLRRSFKLGAEFLRSHYNAAQKTFDYEYYPQDGEVRKGRYNMIRHNLAVFTMIQAYELTGDERYADAAKGGIEFVMSLLQKDDKKGGGICFYNHPKYDRKYKLGGAATLLYALMEYSRLKEAPKEWMDAAKCLGSFLIYMQKDGGEYESFYNPDDKDDGGKDEVVTIYPGEADLALVSLYRRYGDKKIMDALEKSFKYYSAWFKKNEGSPGLLEPYVGWGMSAYAELYRVTKKQEHLDFTRQMGTWILRNVNSSPKKVYASQQFGSQTYALTPSAAPLWNAGVYAEGLAYLALLDKSYLPQLSSMLWFASNIQLQPADALLFKNAAASVGCVPETQFNLACRLDYVYHCLSGMHRLIAPFNERSFPAGAKDAAPAALNYERPDFPLPIDSSAGLWVSPYAK